MLNCPRCETDGSRKDGRVLGRQRYLCRGCGLRYTVKKKGRRVPNQTLRNILHLYIEGNSIRRISASLDVSPVSVSKWLKTFGDELKEIRKVPSEETVTENAEKCIAVINIMHRVKERDA